MTSTLLPVSAIAPESNDRTDFDPERLALLGESIKAVGHLIQPIVVKPRPGVDGEYLLVAGERRWRAHQLIGRTEIEAIVTSEDDRDASMQMLAENAARADLNPIEEGLAYRHRMEAYGETVESLAKVAGKKVAWVQSRIDLLDLAPDIVEMIRNGQLAATIGESMIGLDEPRQRAVLAVAGKIPYLEVWNFAASLRAEMAEQRLFDLEEFMLRQDEFVADLNRKTVQLTPRQVNVLIDRVLASLRGAVDERTLSDEERADLAQLDAILDDRFRANKMTRVPVPTE